MSFSFRVQAATKNAAIRECEERMDAICEVQPIHRRDRDFAIAAATTYIRLLADVPGKDIEVNLHGSCSWTAGESESDITNASVGVNVALVKGTTP